jgi:carbon-monoxide dehydrogenase medium subunit
LNQETARMYRFDYQRPASREAALAAFEGDTRYLAGGQSLVQAMKLRMSASERLVDLGSVADLSGIRSGPDQVVVGAMSRHADVAASPEVRRLLPALAELAEGIGDPAVRSMGTLGGALANADPAACYPAAVLALGATVRTDRRAIAGGDFFTGVYQTALEPDELVTDVAFPLPRRAAYAKLRQPASRFAIVGVFVAEFDDAVRVAVTGAGAFVYREPALEAALTTSFTAAAARAVALPSEGLNSDLHASADYRAAMVCAMAARAVERALSR